MRSSLVRLAAVSCLFLTLGDRGPAVAGEPQGPNAAATDPVQRLVEGNQRYAAAKATHPDGTAARRTEVAKEQKPFAVVLGCADSRVPPELVFDQGLGDLFVVRVAGNVADDAVLGSIEYAVEHLGASVVVVLGHERCGACKAALDGGEAPGHLHALVDPIAPAVRETAAQPGDRLDNVVRANVRLVVGELAESKPLLAHLVEEHKLRVIGARYDLDTGEVEFLK